MGNKIKDVIAQFDLGNTNIEDIATKTGAGLSTVKTQLYKWKKLTTPDVVKVRSKAVKPTPKVEQPKVVVPKVEPVFVTTITEQEFKTYVRVRDSGKTNMFDIPKVIQLSGGKLNKEKCTSIMCDFAQLSEKYLI